MFKDKDRGFTLIELMIVIAIIAFLAMISVPSFLRFLSKAKRAEAYMNLNSIWAAQKSYWAENNTYSNDLKKIGWKPEGYSGGGKNEQFYYTYGFNEGSEGQNYFTGKLETEHTALEGTKANKEGFVAAAAGDIDNDGEPDVLTVNEKNVIQIVKDDLV